MKERVLRGLPQGIIHRLAVAIAIAAMMSCTSQPEPTEYLTLPARFADEGPQEPLVALDAWRNDTEFFVRYRYGDEVRYSGGEWASRVQLETLTAAGNQDGPFILPLQYHRTEPWSEMPPGPVSATILSSGDWQAFRDAFLESILPRDAKTGIVLHFYQDDYFLYFDAAAEFQSVVLDDKPADYSIAERVSFVDFLDSGIPLLADFLEKKGIDDNRIVFNTGDTGAYSLPFLYVNLEYPVAVFGRLEPEGRARGASRAVPIIQSAGHLTQSHTSAIVFRPISSVYRLLFVTKEAVSETVRPDWLVALEETPIQPIYEGSGMDLDDWEKKLDELTGRETSKGTIEYLVDGEEFFSRFIETITAATESIDLRTYIFDNDDYAERIGELLKKRSNEGVEVRMLFDGFGTIVSTIEQQETLPEDWKGTASVREFLETETVDLKKHRKGKAAGAGD